MCKKIKRISYFSTNPHDQNTFKLEEHPTVGRAASLSRFIARLGERALPFYTLIKMSEKL
jgi:hypothetical protein